VAVKEGRDIFAVEEVLLDVETLVELKAGCNGAVALAFKVDDNGEAECEASVGVLEKDRKEAQLAAVVRNRDLSTTATQRR